MRALTFALLFFPVVAAAEQRDRSHRFQGGVGVTVGSGYRVLFRYANAATCGSAGLDVCHGVVPAWLDVKAFFGVGHRVDVLVEQRIGLEKDFTLSHPLLLMPGIRVYPDGRKPLKFFVQLQAVFDFTDPGSINLSRYDVGFHEVNGFQWDFLPWMGAYFQISETFGFVRSFLFQLEAGGGIEGRFP